MKLINGVPHEQILLKVVARNVVGVPMTLELVPNEQKIDITRPENQNFITAWTPSVNLEGKL